MDIFKIALIGNPLGNEQTSFLKGFSEKFNTDKNQVEFIDISKMTEEQILAQGAFNGVLYSLDGRAQEENSALETLLKSQISPDDLSFFSTSKNKVTEQVMEEENEFISERLGNEPSNSAIPIRLSNENEINAFLQGIIAPTALAYFSEVNEITDKTSNKINSFVDLVMSATEQKHTYTAGHVQRVSRYVEQLAKELNFTEREQKEVSLSAKLHDIGKIGIPDEVLASTKALNYNERLQMDYHSQLGEAILQNAISNSPALQQSITPEVLQGIRNHHRHYDGYHSKDKQDPIHGEAVGKYGLTIAVADCIDAMTSQRAYNNPKHILDTFRDLWFQRGKQFSPEIAQTAILMLGKQIAELGIDPNKMFAESYNNPRNDKIDTELKNFFSEHSSEIEVNQSPEPNQYSSLGFRLNQIGYFEFEGLNSPVWNPQIRVDDEYTFQEGKYARDNDISPDRLTPEICEQIHENVLKKFDVQDKEGALAISRGREKSRDLLSEIQEAAMEDFEYNSANCIESARNISEEYNRQNRSNEIEERGSENKKDDEGR